MMLCVTRCVPALGALAFCLQPSFAGDLVPTADISTPRAAAASPLCGALPTQQCDPSIARGRAAGWPQVWGYLDMAGVFVGERMAPNGVPFDPLFVTSLNLNIGLMPNKKLYVFTERRRNRGSASPTRIRATLISASANSISMSASLGTTGIVSSCGRPHTLPAISIAAYR
jgi:hypothetical protein